MGLRQFSTECQSVDAECRSQVCLKKNPCCAHDIAARDARIKPTNIFHFTPFWRIDASYAEIGNGNVADDQFETPDDISRSYRLGLTPMWQGHEDHMDEAAWNPSVPTPGEMEDLGWPVLESFCKYESYNFTGIY